MRSRALRYTAGAFAVFLSLGAARASAQQMSQRGQPRRAFALADFGKLRWLEGTWEATSPGETTLYEKFHFADDSTVEISYYRDSTMAQSSGTGRLYLSVGRVFHSFGPNRWGATHIGADGVYFVPQVNARNTFAWDFKSNDAWTVTMRSGLSGRDRVTVWDLKRLK